MAELIPGMRVRCKIRTAELNGFSVEIVGRQGNAHLSSKSLHSVGDEVLGTYLCFDRQRRRFIILDQFSRLLQSHSGDTAGGDSYE